MVKIIPTSYSNVAAFHVTDAVTLDDYKNTIIPETHKLKEQNGKINMVYVLDAPLANFTLGAYWEDAVLAIKNLFSWNRVAVVCDNEHVVKLINAFKPIIPAGYKSFPKSELDKAIEWAAHKELAV